MDKKNSMFLVLYAYIIGIILSYFLFTRVNLTFDILISTLIVDAVLTFLIFLFSIMINNSSVYDPYWSIIPFFIFLLWVFKLQVSLSLGVILIGIIIFLWGFRLTRNWFITFKGFSIEDWRYVDFRNRFKRFYWIVSLLGIHLFPTLIVFAGMTPIYFALNNPGSVNIIILIIGFIFGLISVLLSYYSDKELIKHRKLGLKTSINTGLWKFSRHPNYLGELTFWFSIYIMSISYNLSIYYTGIGFIAMVILFQAYSIPAMEKKLLKNKDDYQDIINTIPRLLPIKLKK